MSSLNSPASAVARTRKARQPQPQALPFPDLPDSKEVGDVIFWLSAWMRDIALQATFVAHTDSTSVQKLRRADAVLSLALTVARMNATDQILESVRNLKDVGGLLFAFPGTTKLQQLARSMSC